MPAMSKRIADGEPVNVSGYEDPETGEPIERAGVIVSGGHTVDGIEHYDVQIDDEPFAALVAADRISPAE
jgi:hypothetical protein